MALAGAATGGKLIGKLFGNAVSSAIGFGAGVAMAPALGPVVRDISNSVNSKYAFVFPEPGTLANGVAQGQIDAKKAGRWASYWGVGDAAFAALVEIANTGPGVPTAFDLWRRGVIEEPAFRRAAKRQGLEQEWIDDLVKIKGEILDPGELARAIHRGLVPDPGLLRGTASPGPGKVESYPVYPIDALAEAAGSGIDHDRLGVMVGLQGLPMGSHEAAQALFRGVIDDNDYLRAIAEGNTRNEWADAIRDQSRQIVTVHEGVENAIRGYSTLADAIAQGARHGMSAEDVTLIYQNAGRPLVPHQITTGLARGAKFNPIPGEIPDPYEAAAHEASVKPSYQELYIAAGKYSYPPLFQLNQLVKGKAITAATAKDWAVKQGYAPEVIDALDKYWVGIESGGGSGGTAAKEATVTDLLKLWDGGKATELETLTAIEALGYPTAEAQSKLDTLDAARVVGAKAAAIGDLHTVYKKGALPDTNAVTALEGLGVHPWAAPLIVAAWRHYLTAVGGHPPVTLP